MSHGKQCFRALRNWQRLQKRKKTRISHQQKSGTSFIGVAFFYSIGGSTRTAANVLVELRVGRPAGDRFPLCTGDGKRSLKGGGKPRDNVHGTTGLWYTRVHTDMM